MCHDNRWIAHKVRRLVSNVVRKLTRWNKRYNAVNQLTTSTSCAKGVSKTWSPNVKTSYSVRWHKILLQFWFEGRKRGNTFKWLRKLVPLLNGGKDKRSLRYGYFLWNVKIKRLASCTMRMNLRNLYKPWGQVWRGSSHSNFKNLSQFEKAHTILNA